MAVRALAHSTSQDEKEKGQPISRLPMWLLKRLLLYRDVAAFQVNERGVWKRARRLGWRDDYVVDMNCELIGSHRFSTFLQHRALVGETDREGGSTYSICADNPIVCGAVPVIERAH